MSPLLGNDSVNYSFHQFDSKQVSSDESVTKNGNTTCMKTVVINNSSSSSSGKGSKLLVVDNYIEPIFKIEKVLSNKSNSNENSSGNDGSSSAKQKVL